MGVSFSMFLCLYWDFYFLLFLCLVVLFPWVYGFFIPNFFNVYTWTSPIWILIDFDMFLWNSYSLNNCLSSGTYYFCLWVQRVPFCFLEKKYITNFFLFIILFVKCTVTYTIEKSCQILIIHSRYIYVYVCFICSLWFMQNVWFEFQGPLSSFHCI